MKFRKKMSWDIPSARGKDPALGAISATIRKNRYKSEYCET